MPHYIKTGFWEKLKKGYKGWLDLDELISKNLPTPYTPPLEYVAILNQSGTNAPTATILSNTANVVFTFHRYAAGIYYLLNSEIDYSKVSIFLTNGWPAIGTPAWVTAKIQAPNDPLGITITTSVPSGSEAPPAYATMKDSVLYKASLRIIIYP